MNKKILESLIRCGAFDFTDRDRADLFSQIDTVMASAASAHRDRASGQASMFDDLMTPSAKTAAPKTNVRAGWTPWTNAEKLAHEKELLGFYVTGHPLNPYRSLLTGGKYTPIAQLGTLEDRATFHAAGSLTEVAKKFSKKDGKPWAIITLEDLSSSTEIFVWNEMFTKHTKILEPGQIVAITGRVDRRSDELRLVVNEISLLKAPKKAAVPVRLRFEMERLQPDELGELRDILAASPGECPVELEFCRADGHRLLMEVGLSHRVRLTPELEQRLGPRLSIG